MTAMIFTANNTERLDADSQTVVDALICFGVALASKNVIARIGRFIFEATHAGSNDGHDFYRQQYRTSRCR